MSSSPAESRVWAVILAGGVGSRFWPVSTPGRPKQLLPLASERPLIADTVARIAPLVPAERIRVVTAPRLAGPIREAVPELPPESLLLEPRARGTAPALAWAAHEIARAEPGAVLVSLHADHAIEPAEAFRGRLAELAVLAAREERLFTIGAVPTRPETGFGYIRVGEPLVPALGVCAVADFVEKPDRDTAREYLRSGGYLWNTGIFLWRVDVFLSELADHTPEIATRIPLLDAGRVAEFFEAVPMLSVDEGLLERSERVAVAEATFGWDDVGSWDAVGRTRPTDGAGNVAVGDAHLVDAERCIVWAEDGPVVVFGGQDLVAVRARGITFVAPRERTPELKELLARLPERLREGVEE